MCTGSMVPSEGPLACDVKRYAEEAKAAPDRLQH
eukprot:CAMPEP_0179074208 /NCGR_PEP_ID=MMETSP0796-20121207/32969_1 /TAXON_ID=73915 /ORGANISM="Pyrodinium bahamense, Strain pbaha01" /LENGTH=33 /DNA_ID= /DNA_START= /DNA_END= /DNA_ORIENTATION=